MKTSRIKPATKLAMITGSSLSFLLILAFVYALPVVPPPAQNTVQPNTDIWVTAYLASWQHNAGTAYSNWGAIKTEDIDWDAITHLIYFALNIGEDGRPGQSLNPEERRNFNTDRLNTIVPAAHRHNTKILFSVGGSGNYQGFSSSITKEHRSQFINTIAELIETYGFDGVDLDMEPIREKDFSNFYQFVISLQARLFAIETRSGETPLITIAALKGEKVMELYARLQHHVDQINIMTYDMAQAWAGWQAWHNSALYSGEARFERTGGELSSIHQKVELALAAGILPEKLGIGIDFYGYIWNSVHFLGKWERWPEEDLSIMERPGGVPYSELYQRFDLEHAEWDDQAKTSYLNSENPRAFVSFDNERSVREKVQYAINRGLGGVILWELGGGFFEHNPPGLKDPLLQAVKSSKNIYTQNQIPITQ